MKKIILVLLIQFTVLSADYIIKPDGTLTLQTIQDTATNNEDYSMESNRLYGLTLDSIEDIDQSVDALKSFSKRTTTRVVFDEISAKEYTTALNKLLPYTDIMGELFDSEYINNYTIEEYQNRVDEYLDAHGDKVDIWEIGNEVNGIWTGTPSNCCSKNYICV